MKPLLMLVFLLASSCSAIRALAREDNAPPSNAEIKKAPPEAVTLAANNGLPNPNELICAFEKDTGTNIPEKTCKTRWQLDEERREAHDWMENHIKNCGINCGH